MPQLQINQGPQDALLYDNTRSYFTNVGYVRTSNFQVEYKTCESQNNAAWGSTVQFIIPKAADLLGPCDLRVTIPAPTAGGITVGASSATTKAGTRVYSQWVDELGFAMIEKITFSVGSNDIETITGEELQLRNELMTSDEMRLGFDTIQKTGKRAFHKQASSNTENDPAALPNEVPGKALAKTVQEDFTRLISCAYNTMDGTTPTHALATAGERTLIIPLGLFFTKHVSQYFPLAAVAGCNDIRISIKLRQLDSLIQLGGIVAASDTKVTSVAKPTIAIPSKFELLCHYVHVTGPEAQTLMNKEHVRLLKMYQHQTETFTNVTSKMDINLSFLHPVSTLIITIRAEADLNDKVTPLSGAGSLENDVQGKGFFFYHGDGTNPNYDRLVEVDQKLVTDANFTQGTCKVDSIQLTLNGQERHPSLNKGIDTDYLRARLLPTLHSNSDATHRQLLGHGSLLAHGSSAAEQAYGMHGSKSIFVYPFSLNPEGSNPSGAVNFSKVSHAKLTINLDPSFTAACANEATKTVPKGTDGFRVDVYALYYNWLQIKDGRALLSFA